MGFNRTFMELKLTAALSEDVRKECFNRTFMELKQAFRVRIEMKQIALIGPLWN